jgi:hypothetical protein
MDVDESSQSDATVTSGKETPVPEEAGPAPATSRPESKVTRPRGIDLLNHIAASHVRGPG